MPAIFGNQVLILTVPMTCAAIVATESFKGGVMGYTSQQYLTISNASNALFRAWGSAVSGAMASMGWTQTGDTGQVNWATVTVPSSARVYEIWQPGDAGTPFYLKLEYGYSATVPTIQISLGTGTNGSGTLTGFVTTAQEITGTSNDTVVMECDFSGDTDRCGIVLNRNRGNQPMFFAVERTKNNDGTNSNVGVTQFCMPTANNGQQSIKFGVGVGIGTPANTFIALANGNGASAIFDSTVPFSPAFPDIGFYGNPQTVLGFVHTQDVANGAYFTTTIYGDTRSYLRIQFQTAINAPVYCALCMRYD